MQAGARLERPPHQQNRFSHGQLGYRPAVRVRIIEYRNPALTRRRAINLVYADAERPYRHQFGRSLEHRRRHAGLRAHAENRDVAHLVYELAFFQRTLQRLDFKTRFF